MHITKSGGNGKPRAYLGQLFVGIGHFLGLGVQLGVVNIRVVHTIFFPSRDPEFNLQSHTHFAHARQVFLTNGNIFLYGFFRKVDHM